jgi:putative DNA primase/helicase
VTDGSNDADSNPKSVSAALPAPAAPHSAAHAEAMTSAAEIAARLHGRRSGAGYVARCPAHEDSHASLWIRDGEKGLLLYCYAGCDFRAIVRALGDIDTAAETDPMHGSLERRQAVWVAPLVSRLWQNARPIAGTLGETYLRQRRSITARLPLTLRFHPHLRHPSGGFRDAIVAAVTIYPDQTPIAVHRIWLEPDGSKTSLDPAKAMVGPVSGGAVRLASHIDRLAVGEGIETVLSYMSLFRTPGWAALSAPHLEKLILPPELRALVICADNDPRGLEAAKVLGARARRDGIASVIVRAPPTPGTDWNDALRGQRAERSDD